MPAQPAFPKRFKYFTDRSPVCMENFNTQSLKAFLRPASQAPAGHHPDPPRRQFLHRRAGAVDPFRLRHHRDHLPRVESDHQMMGRLPEMFRYPA